jgi:hypothetical protein
LSFSKYAVAETVRQCARRQHVNFDAEQIAQFPSVRVDDSMELAQHGAYDGREHVRAFLLKVFGRGSEGPVANRLGNHLQLQPVIDIAPDGKSAKIRIRMFQQMSFGPRASVGAAVYENTAVLEDGKWKLRDAHTYNTLAAGRRRLGALGQRRNAGAGQGAAA